MALNDWMSQYGNRKLGRLHMPGAHDAGTAKDWIDLTVGGTNSNAATQELTITQMLGIGTRFFDLRLAKDGGKVVAHHTTAGQGALSRITVDKVLEDAADFCNRNRSEIVIFRISHTSAKTRADQIAIASTGDRLHTGTGNLCLKKLSDIARDGNLICIFDEDKFAIDQSKGIQGFAKYQGASTTTGISCCGCYERTHKLGAVISAGLRGQYLHNERHNANLHDHLWQVYWQKTYTNPASTTGIEDGAKKGAYIKNGKVHGGTHAATGYMLSLMKGLGNPLGGDHEVLAREKTRFTRKTTQEQVMYSTLDFRNYALPNVVSYDFVNPETNELIIGLNDKTLRAVRDDNL